MGGAERKQVLMGSVVSVVCSDGAWPVHSWWGAGFLHTLVSVPCSSVSAAQNLVPGRSLATRWWWRKCADPPTTDRSTSLQSHHYSEHVRPYRETDRWDYAFLYSGTYSGTYLVLIQCVKWVMSYLYLASMSVCKMSSSFSALFLRFSITL